MPFHYNKVQISGTMTRDAEIKHTPQGTAIANISLAVNRVYYKGEGKSREKQEETTFVEVEAWGKTAEIIQEHTGKGHTIFIEGRLKLDQWEDKQTGAKRTKLRVVAENFKFVSSPKATGEGPPPQRPTSQKPTEHDPDLDQPAEDDIPY